MPTSRNKFTYYAFTFEGRWYLWEENHQHPEWSRLIPTPFSAQCDYEYLATQLDLFRRAILVPPDGLPLNNRATR